MNSVPVLAIDGPSGSGKGTVARQLAKQLGWALLDSGALYRLTAVAATQQGLDADNPQDCQRAVQLARKLPVRFAVADNGEEQILLAGEDVTRQVRAETTGELASRWAVLPEIRAALLGLQHDFRQAPGLVADGRDMGTVVFPDAELKVFLEASAQERARRRYKQLSDLRIPAKIDSLCREIEARDERDRNRKTAPLVPAADAVRIETSHLSAAAVLEQVCKLARQRFGVAIPQ